MSRRDLPASDASNQEFDELLSAINKKLKANAVFVSKSSNYGRLTWRKDGNGPLKVKLDLSI